ncbi:MAG: alpha/beta fold hydrolase [Shimia sp.]
MSPTPVVFLPGMMCDARLFAPQMDALSATRPVMFVPALGERIERMAQHVLEVAPARFSLVGLSMGGIVAMEVARRAKDRLRHLALLDTNPVSETPERAAAREPQIVAAKSGRLEEVMRDEMKPAYLAETPHKTEILAMVMDMARALGPEAFVRQSRALQRRRDQQATLRRITVPTLVLCGEHDGLCPPARHEFMAQMIPGAELRIVPGAGHLPTLEAPGAVTEALRSLLSREATAAA